MYLIHRALSAEAARVQKLIEQLEVGGSLQPFRAAFNTWATCLMYHADVEDRYMTEPLEDFQAARDNEAEHVELAELLRGVTESLDEGEVKGIEERVKRAIVALHDEQHVELMERLEDVLAVLNGEIGRTSVIARTKRHLYGKVVALRICQDDHLESEEAFVLPEVRTGMRESQQLELVRRLLTDQSSDNPRWIRDWVAREVGPTERKLLADLEARYSPLSLAADDG